MTLHRFTFRAMAADNEVQVHADAALARDAASAAIAEVARVEAKYSRYRPESVVSRINAAAGRAAVAIDLAAGEPYALQGLEAEGSEGDTMTALGRALHAALVHIAALAALGLQHGC